MNWNILLGRSLLLGILLFLTGCVTQPTPEAAVLRQLGVPAEIEDSYQVVTMQEASDDRKLVVLVPTQRQADQPKLVYAFARRSGWGWRARSASVYDDPVADNRIITGQRFAMPAVGDAAPDGRVPTGLDAFVLVRQDDLDSRITAMEVTFDDGQTLRTEPMEGVFVALNPDADTPCAITFLAADCQVISTDAWPGPAMPHNCSSAT